MLFIYNVIVCCHDQVVPYMTSCNNYVLRCVYVNIMWACMMFALHVLLELLPHYRYAASHIEETNPRSRFATWQPITMSELKGFMSLILSMGLIDIPTLEGYWSTSWESNPPFFRRVMSRERFLRIFPVGDGQQGTNKPLSEILSTNFQAHHCPSQDVAVDETIVGFHSCFGTKQ